MEKQNNAPFSQEFQSDVAEFVSGNMQSGDVKISYLEAKEVTRDLIQRAERESLNSRATLRDIAQLVTLLELSISKYARES